MPERVQPIAGSRIGLVTAALSRSGGGVFEAVVAQAQLICRLGGEPIVFGLADRSSTADADRFDPGSAMACRVIGPRQIGWAPLLGQRLAAARLDLVHLHGIWTWPTAAALGWTRRTGRPLVISPHGMLDPWILARGRWKKALARAGYERAAWASAARLHALTTSEASDIAVATGRQDAVVIPNPAPDHGDALSNESQRPPRLVYLGRIHPKKNLAALLAAWSAAQASHALPVGAELIIAGWGEAADLAALRGWIAGTPSVAFVGQVAGQAKQDLLSEARFLILPSLSEGLPMVLLEAWAAATPTLQSAACHLPQAFASGAAIDCGFSPATITTALVQAFAQDDRAWNRMSQAALALARGPFSVREVAHRWADCYGALLAGYPATFNAGALD